jgi:hypothetical protein
VKFGTRLDIPSVRDDYLATVVSSAITGPEPIQPITNGTSFPRQTIFDQVVFVIKPAASAALLL